MDVEKNIIEFRRDDSSDEAVLAGYINEYAEVMLSALAEYGVTKEGTITGNASDYSAPQAEENIIRFYVDGIYSLYIVMYSSKMYICYPNNSLTSAASNNSFDVKSVNFVYYKTEETVLFGTLNGTDYGLNTTSLIYAVVTVKDMENSAYAEKRLLISTYTNTNVLRIRVGHTTIIENKLFTSNINNSQVTRIIKIPFMTHGNYYISEFFNMYVPIAMSSENANNVLNDMRVTVINKDFNTYWVH